MRALVQTEFSAAPAATAAARYAARYAARIECRVAIRPGRLKIQRSARPANDVPYQGLPEAHAFEAAWAAISLRAC